MIIWSGYGVLSVLIAFAGVVLGAAGIEPLIEGAALGLPPGTGLALGLALAAVANWFVGVRLNGRPGRELIDPKTGGRVVIRRRHALFWIPMQYYSVLFALLAVAALFAPPEGTATEHAAVSSFGGPPA